MPLEDDLLYRAQRRDRSALEQLLESVYPRVHRMAAGLSGRDDVARGITRFVLTQSLRRLPQWRDGEDADRWFLHHTLLTARRAAQHQPRPADDLLVRKVETADPTYVAFVRALRTLPFQQREAFILSHGERLNSRYLGVAMDCSTTAADMHLQTARQSLQTIAGSAFETMTDRLARAYTALAPEEDIIRPTVRSWIRRSLWPQRIRRWAKRLLVLAILLAILWASWRFRHLLPTPIRDFLPLR